MPMVRQVFITINNEIERERDYFQMLNTYVRAEADQLTQDAVSQQDEAALHITELHASSALFWTKS